MESGEGGHMKKERMFPTPVELRRLANEIDRYPISDLGIIQLAEHRGYSNELVGFLKLFYREMIFKNRAELLNYCQLLESVMSEEHQSKPELVSSGED
jgi:hypothetical protein